MANKNINDLPTATSLNAGDKLEILQGGTNKQIDSSLLVSQSTPLGLIQIIDKQGDFFTDLATASAYIRTITSATITDESYNNGVYFFTLPTGSTVSDILASYALTTASLIDEFGLITNFDLDSIPSFSFNGGNHKLGKVTFWGLEFDTFSGIVEIEQIVDITYGTVSYFAQTSTGKFIIKGNIGLTPSGNSYTCFLNSTATILVNKEQYTINAGAIQGDLQTAITNGCNVQFDGIDLEEVSNKSTSIVADQASNIKYPSVKSVYDWVTSLGYQVTLTAANFGAFINGLASKATPVDADSIGIVDSAASNVQKKVSLTNLWANYFKPKNDLIYSKGLQSYYSGKYITIPFAVTPTSTGGWNGAIIYIPIPIYTSVTFTQLRQEVTVAVGGANIRLGIFSSLNGVPNVRLDDSGNLSAATTGTKDYTLTTPLSFTPNDKQIFLAIQTSNANIGLRYAIYSLCLNYFSGSGQVSSLYIETRAFGAFPATATPTMYTNVNSPLVSLLVQ